MNSSNAASGVDQYPYGAGPECRAGSGNGAFDYSLRHLDHMIGLGLSAGYAFHTIAEVAASRGVSGRTIVLRHDIDEQPERALDIARVEVSRGVRATYFFRTSANEYNLFGYRTARVADELRDGEHELGLHAEPVDIAAARGTTPESALEREIALFGNFEPALRGVGSHNDITPHNNLLFLQGKGRRTLERLGLYEAYGDPPGLFTKGVYVTDSERWFWRVYERGRLLSEAPCVCDLVERGETPLYVLIHPHLLYRKHFHHGSL